MLKIYDVISGEIVHPHSSFNSYGEHIRQEIINNYGSEISYHIEDLFGTILCGFTHIQNQSNNKFILDKRYIILKESSAKILHMNRVSFI